MPPNLPPKYYQIEKAVRQVEAEEISVASFVEFLENILEEFEDGEDEIQDTVLPEQSADDVEDDLEDGLEGIDDCKAALVRLAVFAEDQNPDHLKNGLLMLAEGMLALSELAARNEDAMLEQELPVLKAFNFD